MMYFKQYWKQPKWLAGRDVLTATYADDLGGQNYVTSAEFPLPTKEYKREQLLVELLNFNRSALHVLDAGFILTDSGVCLQWVVPRKRQSSEEWDEQLNLFYQLLQQGKQDFKKYWM